MHGMCEDGFATGCWRCAPVAHLLYCTVRHCTALCCIGAGNLIDVEDVPYQIRYSLSGVVSISSSTSAS